MKRRMVVSPRARVLYSLFSLSLVSIGLFIFGAIQNHSTQFSYLTWNLCLAWLPLLFVVLLVRSLRWYLWSSWRPVVLTLLWLLFLPNSFYMITDFIHLLDATRYDLLYDVVMFSSFICTAALTGLVSLHLVHVQLFRRIGRHWSSFAIGCIIFVCSFAIYVGRDLRWNSWDVLLNPAGLLFDVSDRIIHPLNSAALFRTTLSFFVLIGSLYIVAWQMVRAIRSEHGS